MNGDSTSAIEINTPREQELRAALEADTSTLGDIYRLSEAGKSLTEIQETHGTVTVGYIYNYRLNIRALIQGGDELPDRPSMARSAAQAFRRILKRSTLSDTVRRELEADLQKLDDVVADTAKVTVETESALDATQKAEEELAVAKFGSVYVYSLPHYLIYRKHEDGRTYLKVGKTINDPARRIKDQVRQTALPEEPVALRYYLIDDERSALEVEQKFHALINAADHERSKGSSVGKEWFLTSVKFTDAIANILGLRIEVVSNLGD